MFEPQDCSEFSEFPYRKGHYEIVTLSKKDSNLSDLTFAYYQCVLNGLFIKSSMFEIYGKWDEAVFEKNKKEPMLIWKNKTLFEDDPTKITLFVDSYQLGKFYSVSSFAATDSDGNDLLKKDTSLRFKLINYISKLIKRNIEGDEAFFTEYYKDFPNAPSLRSTTPDNISVKQTINGIKIKIHERKGN